MEGQVLRAGISHRDITPDLTQKRYDLAGTYTPRVAEVIHDPLYAKFLYLNNQCVELLFVVCDLTFIEGAIADEARQKIHETTHIPYDTIFISATHTHSAPFIQDLEFLLDVLVDGAKEAKNDSSKVLAGITSI